MFLWGRSFVFEIESCYIAQAGLRLLSSKSSKSLRQLMYITTQLKLLCGSQTKCSCPCVTLIFPRTPEAVTMVASQADREPEAHRYSTACQRCFGC